MPNQRPEMRRRELTAPPDAFAAIYFCPGQLYYSRLHGNSQTDKPISAASYRRSGAEVEVDTGWLTPDVVRCGEGPKGTVLMSFRRPAVRRLHVHFQGTKPTPLEVPLPGLLLAGFQTNYFIWALKKEEFSPAAELYQSPLPNINSNGKICFGRNQLPIASAATINEVWKLFFESPFNADQSQGKSLARPADIRPALRRLARERATRYPLDDLVALQSYSGTAADAWDDLVKFTSAY